jgi:membrane-associated protease RseP (regulator of RpoE activity)
MILALGLLICVGAYCGGRALARRLFAVPGVRVLGKRADDSYFATPRARRVAFRLAGPVAVYATCVLLLFAVQIANPIHEPTTTVDVVPGGPAATAGMASGDRVLSIDGVETPSWDAVKHALGTLGPGHPTSIRVQRGGAELTLAATTDQAGKLQVSTRTRPVARSVAGTLAASTPMPVTLLVDGVRAKIAGRSQERHDELGPVGILREASSSRSSGQRSGLLLMLVAYPAVMAWPFMLLVELLMAPRRQPPMPAPRQSARPAP